MKSLSMDLKEAFIKYSLLEARILNSHHDLVNLREKYAPEIFSNNVQLSNIKIYCVFQC